MPKWLKYVLLSLAILLVVGGSFLARYVNTLGPHLKNRVVNALQDRFDADVQLANLQFSLFPNAHVDGDNLVIKHRGWGSDTHPLIRIRHFHAQTDYTTILDWHNQVNEVRLDGLEIHIPPRGPATSKTGIEANQPVSTPEAGHDKTQLRFVINTIVADHALVEIEPRTAGKQPLDFPIEKLTMHSVGPAHAMAFDARLTNATPPGTILTTGHFGPWQRDDPRATPLAGKYIFQNADLSVFKGISGILSSDGHYTGILQHINVDGATDVPDFRLTGGGVPVHLTTTFHAVVDGTNGDTILDPVDAKFGHSEFICSGGVVQEDGALGKTVDLDAHTRRGLMQDILTLIVKGPPLLDGEVQFRSKIVIPPAQVQVMDKLGLDGEFRLLSATFTDRTAAERLRILSDRASGISRAQERRGQLEQGNVASNLFGRFSMRNGDISFANLEFEVPGAHIQLAGNFNLDSSKVDMHGKFEMRATLSQTQSGFRALLLKPLDPVFKKEGAGFEVPLSVTGTRDRPVIGVTIFHRKFDIH